VPDPEVQIVAATNVGPADLRWEKKAEELEFEALAKVRGAAEKWGTTLTAILGLVSTVLVVKGAEDVTKLSSNGKLAVALILGAALVCAVAAAAFAAFAAQGTPKELGWPSGRTLRRWERSQALKAKGQLRVSRSATILAVILMATALGVSWFGARAETSGSTLLFTPAQGKPLCGAVVNGGSELELEVGDAKVKLPEGPYNTVTAVGACPEVAEESATPNGE
jgi:hypothetical protein